VGNLVSPDSATIMQNTIWFPCVHTQRLLNKFLSRVYNTSLKIKKSEMDSRPPQTLVKPYKYPSQDQEKRVGKKKRKKRNKKTNIDKEAKCEGLRG